MRTLCTSPVWVDSSVGIKSGWALPRDVLLLFRLPWAEHFHSHDQRDITPSSLLTLTIHYFEFAVFLWMMYRKGTFHDFGSPEEGIMTLLSMIVNLANYLLMAFQPWTQSLLLVHTAMKVHLVLGSYTRSSITYL